MPTITFDPSEEGMTQAELASQAAALAQGEVLAEAEESDRTARLDELSRDTEQADLIGGKFKSQDELLKAYKELEAKLGKKPSEEEEDTSEEPTEATEEVPVEEPQVDPFQRAAEEYSKGGDLSEESLDALSKLDSKELIKSYMEFYTKSAGQLQQQQSLQQADQAAVMALAGGEKAYADVVQWAAQNLDPSEVEAYNSVTSSGSLPAIKFAVEALTNRYKAAEGSEPELVSGKKAPSRGPKPYRSNAELARDIANPRYDKDPAFRQDVMERLASSGNLL
jgi:hypothetical protein